MRKIKRKIIITGMISTLLLTGCKNNNSINETLISEEATKSYESLLETESAEKIKETETTFVKPTTEIETETIVLEQPTSLEETTKEATVQVSTSNEEKDDDVEYVTINLYEFFGYVLHGPNSETELNENSNLDSDVIEDIKEGFQSNVEEIKELVNSDEVETAKKVGKEYVTKFIDFLFYGDEINGITIDDCTDIVKQDIYDYFVDLDKVLIAIDPEYKEELGIQYEAIKELSIDGYNAAKEYVIEQIGQDKYDELSSKKDEVLESAAEDVSSYVDKFINFLDEKYQEWKESDKKINKKYILKR